MTQQWRRDVLPEIVAQLATRPGHEAVRVGLTRLIVDGLGRQVGGVDHEFRMPLIGGRADTLFASTVFELKSDLGRELPDVLAKLPDYLRERARLTGRPLGLGIATDGATFLAYELREDVLTQIGQIKADPRNPEALLGWLEPAVSEREDLDPARHFDNLMWELPIPEYNARDPLHQELADLAVECERVAAAVVIDPAQYFTRQRRAIRDALLAAGLAARLDALVARMPGL